jgi:hypothetical protein
MTEGDLLGLREGDPVEVLLRGTWHAAKVVEVHVRPGGCRAVLLRADGGRSTRRSGKGLRRPARLDPAASNVFADWLEEHGHEAAAAALRQAFPTADRYGSTPGTRRREGDSEMPSADLLCRCPRPDCGWQGRLWESVFRGVPYALCPQCDAAVVRG